MPPVRIATTLVLKTKKPESPQCLFMAYSILDVVSKYSNANEIKSVSRMYMYTRYMYIG